MDNFQRPYENAITSNFKLALSSNVLHSSGPNTSLDRRWNLVLAYNQVSAQSWNTKSWTTFFQVANAPLTPGFLPPPQPLLLVEDEDVLAKARSVSPTNHCHLLPKLIFVCDKINYYRAESTICKKYMVHADDTSTQKLEWRWSGKLTGKVIRCHWQ